jgi:hypothetical protein
VIAITWQHRAKPAFPIRMLSSSPILQNRQLNFAAKSNGTAKAVPHEEILSDVP